MSKVWNSSYENDIDDDTAGSLIDDNITTLKSEIRKRLETFFDNWANDPDAPTTLDVKDDAILAEHISGLTGTGAVDLSKIPGDLDDILDGSTYKRVTGVNSSHQVTNSSIADDAVINSKIADDAVTTDKIDLSNSEGSHVIEAHTAWIPPAGFYHFFSGENMVPFMVYLNGAWRNMSFVSSNGGTWGWTGWCDGTNMRFYNGEDSSVTIYYRKLA